MKLLLLLLLAAASALALRALWLTRRGRAARALFAAQRGLRGDAPGDLGLSVLCCCVESAAEVERLLAVDYPCCEVVAVLDSARRPELFAELMTRYRMFRVGSCCGLSAPGIRGLARSRQRCFRRLLLVDRTEGPAPEALAAAACVATYDYLLPLPAGTTLRPDAVERLAAAVSEHRAGEIEAVRTQPEGRTAVVAREALVEAGGDIARAWRRTSCRRRLTLWEPIFEAPAGDEALFPAPARRAAAALLALTTGFAAGMAWWPFAALLLTAALIWSAAATAALPITGRPAPEEAA